MGRWITVNDRMQRGYSYKLTEPEGGNFDPDFTPELTPPEMLSLGVFGGKYMTDCRDEFPKSWFRNARLSPEKHDATLNFFGVAKERLDLSRRPAGLVPMVLPLLPRAPLPG
jgi:hypothetical protein